MKIDYAKRRRVMERSIRLGHCICDPRKPCPCDVFTDQGYCPCAGEKPDPVDAASVRLTELVHSAGCASKIAPADLEAVLRRLPPPRDAAVIVGLAAADDAGVYQLDAGTRLVQTIDVMTPCVDDAYLFGRICAANCLSDIYAMGGEPRTALSLVAFNTDALPTELIYQQLKGAMEAFEEAGVSLIGGHSIKDVEPKLGFAITGTLDDRTEAVLRGGARVGDVLVLTKPLGVGALNFAGQIGRTSSEALEEMQRWMATLNKNAAQAMLAAEAHACIDITGFGLFGHLIEMLRRSNATAEVDADALPALPGALEGIRDDVIPGAIERNREYVADDIEIDDDVEAALVHLGFDAQTSGGLLISIAADRRDTLLSELAARGVSQAWVIGRITAAGTGGRILVTTTGSTRGEAEVRAIAPEIKVNAIDEPCCPEYCCCDAERSESSASEAGACCPDCCADEEHNASATQDAAQANSTAAEAARGFGGLMRAATQSGKIDARTKELVNIALILLARCEPCLAHHFKRARELGISRAELDEIAWCTTAMGGAPVKMFYDEHIRSATRD